MLGPRPPSGTDTSRYMRPLLVVTSSEAVVAPGVQSSRRAASSGGASRRADNSGAGRRLAGAWMKRADEAARASGTRSESSGLAATRIRALLAADCLDEARSDG